MSNTSKKVLVIDDEIDFIESMRLVLEGEGHEIATATTGDEAVATLQEFHPECVVMDWVLPGISGKDLVTEIRKIFRGRLIVFSAASPEPIREAITGEATLVRKPFDLDKLLSLINDSAV